MAAGTAEAADRVDTGEAVDKVDIGRAVDRVGTVKAADKVDTAEADIGRVLAAEVGAPEQVLGGTMPQPDYYLRATRSRTHCNERYTSLKMEM